MTRKLQKAIIHFWSDLAVVKIEYSRGGLDAYWSGIMNECIAIVFFNIDFTPGRAQKNTHRKPLIATM